MNHINLSKKWGLGALLTALAILGAACSPTSASPEAISAPDATAAGQFQTPDSSAVSPGTESEIEFFGTVQAIGVDALTGSGITFRVTDATEIKDAVEVGDFVKVHAQADADGTLVAREIELAGGQELRTDQSEIRFSGKVEAIGEEAWTIGGRTVLVTPQTEIEDNIEVGDFVEMRARVEADGTLVADRIQLDSSGPGRGDDDDNRNDNDDDHNGNANDNHNDNADNGNGNANDNGNQNENDNDNSDENGNGNDNDDNTNANQNSNANDNGNDNDDTHDNENSNTNDNDDDGDSGDNDNGNGDDNG